MSLRADRPAIPRASADLDSVHGDVESIKRLRGLSSRAASFGRSIDIAPGTTWPGQAVLDARDETGGRDWCVYVEPEATSRPGLLIDPDFPIFIACFGGAEGVEQSLDGVFFDQGPAAQAPRPPFWYASPRGSCFRMGGEKMRVTAGQFPLGNGAPQTWRIKVTATRTLPRESFVSTDVRISAGATQILRPPKYSVAYRPAGSTIGVIAVQEDENQAALLPAFGLSVPGARIPLARQCTYLAITNGTANPLVESIQWEVFS